MNGEKGEGAEQQEQLKKPPLAFRLWEWLAKSKPNLEAIETILKIIGIMVGAGIAIKGCRIGSNAIEHAKEEFRGIAEAGSVGQQVALSEAQSPLAEPAPQPVVINYYLTITNAITLQSAPYTNPSVTVIITNPAVSQVTTSPPSSPGSANELFEARSFSDIKTNTWIQFVPTSVRFVATTYEEMSPGSKTSWRVKPSESYRVLEKGLKTPFLKSWPWLKLQPTNGTPAWFPWGNVTFKTYVLVTTNAPPSH